MTTQTSFVEITDEAELRALVGTPAPYAEGKVRYALHAHDREWLVHSPLCLVATSAPTAPATSPPRATRPAS